jgi:hypothetical protein
MVRKHRNHRSRRTLTLEVLEDRTLLSGNVVAKNSAGVLTITGDNGDNMYRIDQTHNLGVPTLSVTGIATAINGMKNGTANFPLSSVKEIDISEGNGRNTVSLGERAGFSIPGNLLINAGSNANKFSLEGITAGGIGFDGTKGAGTGADTVDYDMVITPTSVITTGAGKASCEPTADRSSFSDS